MDRGQIGLFKLLVKHTSECHVLTLGTPFRIAVLPRQVGGPERDEHVEYGPANNEVVVEHHNGRHDDHAVTEATKQGTEPLINCHGTQSGILPE